MSTQSKVRLARSSHQLLCHVLALRVPCKRGAMWASRASELHRGSPGGIQSTAPLGTPAAEASLHLPNPRALAQAIPEFQSLGYKMRKGMAKLGITYDDLYGNDRNDGTDCHR
jgi:hypothetical protein